jgi:hypothetical protein
LIGNLNWTIESVAAYQMERGRVNKKMERRAESNHRDRAGRPSGGRQEGQVVALPSPAPYCFQSVVAHGIAGTVTSVPLSADTQWLIDRFFRADHRADAASLLAERCARNLPSCEKSDARTLERLRFAAIKVSRGKLDRLHHAVREAQMDWRDLLMAADFGCDMNAHRQWFNQLRSN